MTKPSKPKTSSAIFRDTEEHLFLVALGQRLRALRDRGGITRKSLSLATGVSERHLANLEYGEGNASVLVLVQIATALHCSLAELIGDVTTSSPEWLMIRSLLENRDEQTLHEVRIAIGETLGGALAGNGIASRIALIGLRGAGKSTLGKMLATDLGFPFIELSREIEKLAGCTIAEIQDLYGSEAYRRYERRALEQVLQIYSEAVIATPGGLVSDPVNSELLLSCCATIWLQAKPEDHMQRVIAQGDFRPMAGSPEAMQDLKGILTARENFYSRAQYRLDTSSQPLEPTFVELRGLARDILQAKMTLKAAL
jgi:XRE family aerobic/anaerobic benzoate catabolism transcriptional regulator